MGKPQEKEATPEQVVIDAPCLTREFWCDDRFFNEKHPACAVAALKTAGLLVEAASS